MREVAERHHSGSSFVLGQVHRRLRGARSGLLARGRASEWTAAAVNRPRAASCHVAECSTAAMRGVTADARRVVVGGHLSPVPRTREVLVGGRVASWRRVEFLS